jgi:exodeoxyribonuclease-5
MYAYFVYRLGVQTFQKARHGIDPAARGTALHNTLYSIYQKFPGKAELVRFIQSDKFNTYLSELIADTTSDSVGYRHLPTTVRRYEESRIHNKVKEYLNLEKDRIQDFKVHALETSINHTIGGYQLNLIVDRIDYIPGAGYLVIDYKSGTTSLAGLIKNDIHSFQLPLYATAFSQLEIEGICYAELSKSTTGYLGIASEKISIQDIQQPQSLRGSELPEHFNECIDLWQMQIEACVTDIASGLCEYIPSNQQKMRFYSELERAVRQQERSAIGAKQ